MEGDRPTRRESDLQLALLIQEVKNLTTNNKDSHDVLFDKIDCLIEALKGTVDKPGLATRLALTEASITRMWWWLGILSVTIMVAAVTVIRSHI